LGDSRTLIAGEENQRAKEVNPSRTDLFERLGDALPFILPTGAAILPPQLEEHFGFGLLAHKVVHSLGNTDFWRTDPLSPHFPSTSGNKIFGADRRDILGKSSCTPGGE
jgi:hypothetical protein